MEAIPQNIIPKMIVSSDLSGLFGKRALKIDSAPLPNLAIR